MDLAIQSYKRALTLKPDFTDAKKNLDRFTKTK